MSAETAGDVLKLGINKVKADFKLVILLALAFGLVSTIISMPFQLDPQALDAVLNGGKTADGTDYTGPGISLLDMILMLMVIIISYTVFLIPWARVSSGSPLGPLEGGLQTYATLSLRLMGQCLVCAMGVFFLIMAFVSLVNMITPLVGPSIGAVIFFVLAIWIMFAGMAAASLLIVVQAYGRPTKMAEGFALMRLVSKPMVLAAAGLSLLAVLATGFTFVITVVLLPDWLSIKVANPLGNGITFVSACVFIAGINALGPVRALKDAPPTP